MSKSKKPILIMVPGIGDDLAIYYAFAKRWNHLGYETHIISFGWVEITARLQPKMDTFMRHLSRFGDSPLILLVSALAARQQLTL